MQDSAKTKILNWEYGDVSPARYPNPGRKRKSRPARYPNPGRKRKSRPAAKSTNPAGKKKKEREENETLVIQSMKPVEEK